MLPSERYERRLSERDAVRKAGFLSRKDIKKIRKRGQEALRNLMKKFAKYLRS